MRIATWNVNGIRSRLDYLLLWLQDRQPDVVGLQELKVEDHEFPHLEIEAAGYKALVYGQKAWNGVAVLTKRPAEVVRRGLEGQEEFGSRLITAQVGDLSFTTIYWPNGKTLDHEDFPRKLAWGDSLLAHFEQHHSPDEPTILCGDFNVCPTPLDTYSPQSGNERIFHTDEERQRFQALLDWGFVDVFREMHPDERVYSWWDYRAGSFHRNTGLRIDFLMGTKAVQKRVARVWIDRDFRKKKDGLISSDHAPVVLELSTLDRVETPSMKRIAVLILGLTMGSPVAAEWAELAPGLHFGEWLMPQESVAGDSKITILRIDPHRWGLEIHTASGNSNLSYGGTVREWCEELDLVAGINAGMFAQDHLTHLGLLRHDGDLNHGKRNHYLSAAAWHPRRQELPAFRMFDLDSEDIAFEQILTDYGSVVQNLRLIKRPGENRWPQQVKRWSEAALGEDEAGNVLFIMCRSPYSMHDLNENLLELGIDLVAAQHLEGGPEAQLYLGWPGSERELVGSYETGFNENDENDVAWRVPNIIGVRKITEGPR